MSSVNEGRLPNLEKLTCSELRELIEDLIFEINDNYRRNEYGSRGRSINTLKDQLQRVKIEQQHRRCV